MDNPAPLKCVNQPVYEAHNGSYAVFPGNASRTSVAFDLRWTPASQLTETLRMVVGIIQDGEEVPFSTVEGAPNLSTTFEVPELDPAPDIYVWVQSPVTQDEPGYLILLDSPQEMELTFTSFLRT